jgi:hypothetical protein
MENTTCYQEDRVIFIFTVSTRMTSDLLIVVGHSTDYTPKVINTNSVPIRHLSLFPVKFIFFCEISNFPRIYSTIFFFEIIDIRTFKCCRTECQHENGQFSSCVERQCCHSLCGTRLSNSWNKVIIQFSSCVAQMYKCTYIYIRDKLSQCLCMYQEKLWEGSISLMSVMNNCAQPSKSFLADRSNDFNDYQNTHTHNSIITYVLYQHTSKRWQDFK